MRIVLGLLLTTGLLPAVATAQAPAPARAAECKPPANGRAADMPLRRYTARDGSFSVMLPASWRRDDTRTEATGVAAFGPPGEMLRVTFHKASPARPAAESYLRSRATLNHAMTVPSHDRAKEASTPLEVTVDRSVNVPELGDVSTRERTAVHLLADGFVAVEEVSPRAGSCVPGLFERVRASVTAGRGSGRR